MPSTRSSSPDPALHATGGVQATNIDTKALAEQLAHSQSATIYVDVPGAETEEAEPEAAEPEAQVIEGEPPLHVAFDVVRQKLAVRKATEQEVEAASAASTEGAGTSSPVGGIRTSEQPGPGGARGSEGRGGSHSSE